MPASDNNPAASHTTSTSLALPTLQVMTRVLRKTPVPIMLATLTAAAAHGPTPRVSSLRTPELELPAPIGCSICEMPTDYSQFGPFLFAALVVFAVYRRLRRSFGRQPMRPRRMAVRMALLTVLACTLLPLALRSAQYLAAELIGAGARARLGRVGCAANPFPDVPRAAALPAAYLHGDCGVAAVLREARIPHCPGVRGCPCGSCRRQRQSFAAGLHDQESAHRDDIFCIGRLLRVLLRHAAVEIQAPQNRR